MGKNCPPLNVNIEEIYEDDQPSDAMDIID